MNPTSTRPPSGGVASKLSKAIHYAMANWEGLSVFLNDARAPMPDTQA